MCGRYVRRSDKQRIAEHFRINDASLPDFPPSYNVTPQTFQPVICLNRDSGRREIALMRWGLIPFWAKDARMGLSTINAKAETVARAPLFRDALQSRRCLGMTSRTYLLRSEPVTRRPKPPPWYPRFCQERIAASSRARAISFVFTEKICFGLPSATAGASPSCVDAPGSRLNATTIRETKEGQQG
jgi:hypothetical protein